MNLTIRMRTFKEVRFSFMLLLGLLMLPLLSFAQSDRWPHEIKTADGVVITIYQPESESLKGNIYESRAAVSVQGKTAKEPVFGAMWTRSVLQTDRESRMALLESIKVTDVRFPNNPDSAKIKLFKTIIETEIPKWKLAIDLDAVISSLDEEGLEKSNNELIKNDPPKIIYEKVKSVLVLIDGEPKLDAAGDAGVKRVVNTAFIILNDPAVKQYYLNGNGLWYAAASINGTWQQTTTLSAPVKKIADDLLKAGVVANPDSVENKVIPKIIIATTPTELVQSDGVAQMTTIKGTNLLYVKNSEDNIFMDITSQQYFVLVSGRWYKAKALDGTWSYVASDKLPADFAKIPVGTEKDIVLASVAGTPQALDAVHDAQVPQTATVDRQSASTKVEYDGEPKFEKVAGTKDLFYAVNTSSTVLKSDGAYYCVDNGVWFLSKDPNGPWVVSTERPADVDKIEPESPVYNVKYVYIYDYTPDVVYVGYTPGYMGCYVYGPTIVYGTGYYYAPWYGAVYYPRPVTYGFHMSYNPWTGWGFGMSMTVGGCYGWMTFGYAPYPPYWGPCYGGFWGPPYHYPPPYHHCNHYYGNRPVQVNHYSQKNVNYYGNRGGNKVSNNMYNNRNGVQTNDMRSNRAGVSTNDVNRSNRATTANRATNNVYTDRSGNVYRGNSTSDMQKRSGDKWEATGGPQNRSNTQNRQSTSTSQSNKSSVDRQVQNRNNATTNRNNYNQYNSQTRSAGSYGGGGGYRGGGGGGGMRGGGGGRR